MKLSELYKGKKVFWTGKEMLEYVPQATKWLVQGILSNGDQCIVTAPSKTGKSIFSMHLACSLSTGEAFLEEYTVTKPTRVLYVQAEMTMDEVNSRLKRMSTGIGVNPENLRWLYVPSLPFIHPDAGREFIDSIKEGFPGFYPEVIVFDPIYMLSGGRSLKDDDVVQSIVANLSMVRFFYNATLIINHHNHRPTKDKEDGGSIPGDYFGSFIFEAWPDIRFDCQKPDPDGRQMTVRAKANRSGDKVKMLNLTLMDGSSLHFEKDADPKAKLYKDAVLEYFSNVNSLATIDDLVKYVGVNKTLTNGAIKLLLQEEKIQKDDKGVYKVK